MSILQQNEKRKLIINFKQNESLFTSPMIDHFMHYTKDTTIFVVSRNPRDQESYEEDTVRINFK